MSLNIDAAFGIHAQALMLRSRRAEVLAANLANGETPNYKARDINFKAALETATGVSGGDSLSLATDDPRHIPIGASGGLGDQLLYRVPIQPSIDGNTVDAQVEKAEFSQNALQYMTGLLRAIKGE
jgi:flagellar basal-body rod protein FlgB